MNDDPEESLRKSGAQRPHMVFLPKLTQEGGQWVAIYKNEYPPEGEEWKVKPIIGRGSSPDAALQSFDEAWLEVLNDAVRRKPTDL